MKNLPRRIERMAPFAVAALIFCLTPQLSAQDDAEAEEVDESKLSPVAYINHKVQQGYEENEITPSPMADDEEWLRRVYLDIVGRIPTLEESKNYLKDESPRKRFSLVSDLLESSR